MSDDNKEGAGVPVNEHSFVQPVPDHCDRITWRGHYYHLREATPPAVMPAAPSEIELQHREALDCLDSVMRAASHVLVGLAPSEKEAKLRSVLSKAHDWCMAERAALSQTMQPQAEPAAGEQAARNWIHGEAIDYLEVPDVQDESGINAHYSRDLVLQCIDAAIEAGKEQAGAVASESRCSNCDDTGDVNSITGEWRGVCICPAGQAINARALAAPGAAIAAREQEYLKGGNINPAPTYSKPPAPAAPPPVPESHEGEQDTGWQAFGRLSEAVVLAAVSAGVKVHPHAWSVKVHTYAALEALAALASREEAPATPQAAIPAAQGGADERTPHDAMWSAYEKDLPRARLTVHSSHFNTSAPVWFERGYHAALTQPTTMQQAEPTDVVRELPEVECPKCELKVLRNCGGNCPIPNRDGATLKGMQPGERKEGAE